MAPARLLPAGAAVVAVVAVVACCIGGVAAMYEDQAGTADWLKQHVGAPRVAVAGGKRVCVGTDTAVVACLNTRTGEQIWRQVLQPEDTIDDMMLYKRRLVTVSSHGRFVRLWHASTGELVWDARLPDVSSHDAGIAAAAWVHEPGNSVGVAVIAGNALHFLSGGDGEQQWAWQPQGCTMSALVGSGASGQLYAVCGSRVLRFDGTAVVEDGESVTPAAEHTVNVGAAEEVVAVPSDAEGVVLAWVTSAGDVGVFGFASGSTATVPQSQLGAAAEELRLEADGGDGIVVVRLASGDDAVVRVSSGGASGESAVGATGEVETQSTGAISAVVITQLRATSATPEAGSIVSAVTHDGRAYVASASVGPDGTRMDVVADDGTRTSTQVPSVNSDGVGSVARLVLLPFDANSGGVGHRAMLVTTTDAVVMLHAGRTNTLWQREEALAAPTAVVMADSGDHTHAVLGKHDNDEEDEVLDTSFAARIALQIEDATATVKSLMSIAKDPLAVLTQPKSLAGYRANKTIVVLTRAGRMFGVDSITGNQRWAITVAAPGTSAKLLLTRRREMATHPPEVLVLQRHDSRTVMYTYYDAETGKQTEAEGYVRVAPGDLRLASRMQAHDATHRQLVVVVDSEGDLAVLPPSHGARSKFAQVKRRFVFAVVDAQRSVVTGYAPSPADPDTGAIGTMEVWSIAFPAGDVIATSSQVDLEDYVHTPARILGDQSLLLKYLNPNLLVVATTNDGTSAAGGSKVVPSVTLHVIDAVSGRTLESRTHRAATGPVNVLMHENWIQYTYWNRKSKLQELSSLVLYEGSVGNRELNPLHPPADRSGSFSSYHAVDPMVSAQSFVLPTPVNVMALTRTSSSITHRWILMGLESGALWCLDRRFVDPRRPTHVVDKATMQREGLMPYQAHLPLQHTAFASYNLTVDRISHIVSVPTALESTSVVAAVGLDMFSTRVHPSKEFDILSADFNKPLLLLLSGGLLVATFLARAAAQRKRVRAAWK